MRSWASACKASISSEVATYLILSLGAEVDGALNAGILLFCGVLVFHLVTLPLEFDASARALKLLSETNTLSGSELGGAKSVLDAAALTYVAALVMTVLQLVRLLALRNMRRD